MTTAELTIKSERIDDFVLLLEIMKRLGFPVILDHHLTRHGLQQGLSWGWIATIWLAHILSQGDHRKLTVRDWVRQAHEMLEGVTGLDIRETDFTDDRLTLLLRRLSKPEAWHAIELELGQSIVRVYDLKPKRVRLDATTVSGYHTGSEEGLFQFGNSKDDPTLRQIFRCATQPEKKTRYQDISLFRPEVERYYAHHFAGRGGNGAALQIICQLGEMLASLGVEK